MLSCIRWTEYEALQMRNTKLIKVIEKFSKIELKRLREFVHSPFFRASKTEIDLFDFIYKYAPDFNHKKFTSEHAAAYLFPDNAYDTKALIKIQSRLFKLVEWFIYQQYISDYSPSMEMSLMQFYDNNDLSSLVESAYKKFQKKQQAFPHRNLAYYYNQLVVEMGYGDFVARQLELKKGDAHHQKILEILDVFYLREKLIQICQTLNRKRSINVSYNIAMMDEILAFLPDSEYLNIPVIKIWYTALLLLKSPDKSEYYHQLKQLLTEYHELIDQTDQQVLYIYLANTAKTVFNEEAYYKAVWDMFSQQLNTGSIYVQGYLLPTVFKNIVTVALRLNYLDWTEKFLENHKDKIPPSYEGREDVYSYSLAQLYFKQKKNNEVLDILNQTVFNDMYTKMDIRRMYLKVYYEMEYAGMFEDMVNSFRTFLSENQSVIPDLHIQAHRDFVNVIYNIYRTLRRDEKRISAITEQIIEIRILPEKTWLLEKLEALK